VPEEEPSADKRKKAERDARDAKVLWYILTDIPQMDAGSRSILRRHRVFGKPELSTRVCNEFRGGPTRGRTPRNAEISVIKTQVSRSFRSDA
jgi:hypothetical protein